MDDSGNARRSNLNGNSNDAEISEFETSELVPEHISEERDEKSSSSNLGDITPKYWEENKC